MSIDKYILLWIVIGLLTFSYLIISKLRAPYGRHSSDGWGFMINNSWGWFWMELPALLLMPLISVFGKNELNSLSILLISLWFIHYFNRVIIFPMRIKTKNKKMPISIAISAFLFNCINGLLNGIYVGYFLESDININITFIIGVFLFITGMLINIQSDNKLISLRKDSDGYKIPNGGMFRLISCPNHFGEIIEWIGYSFIAFNFAALSFALWTFFNLVPRALNHHEWYNEHFDNYPKKRKAVLPYIL
mgnify:FL=1|tara:strand:+ start:3317 stop:4060 length:744 start_codon:yes stop_codon:yes gene_type:complete